MIYPRWGWALPVFLVQPRALLLYTMFTVQVRHGGQQGLGCRT